MRNTLAPCLLLLAASTSPAPASSSATAVPEVPAYTGLNCVILPDEQVEVSSPVPGVVEEVLVRRSDRVERGQILARLESSVEEATVELASARALSDAEFRLREVEFGYDTQRHERLQELHNRHLVSFQNLEDAERTAEAAQLRIRLAQDRRREALLERYRADAVLALKTVRSPIDGVIVQRHKTVGEYVEDQPIVRIVRLDPLRVEVITPLALFGTVHVGMQMGILPETDPERERIATVRAVDAVADPGSGSFGVELELPNPDLALPAGIKCKGRLLPRLAAIGAGPPPADSVVVVGPASDPEDPNLPVGTAATPGPEIASPTQVDSAAPTTSGACLAYDVFGDEERARALARAAERVGGRASMTEVSEPRAFGYLVLTPPEAGSQDELAKHLREAGITDLAIIKRGAHAGRISLGAYSGPLAAERRSAALAELGFDTEVHPHTRTHRAWRVELRLPAGFEPETADAALAGVAVGLVAETVDCEPLRTAAR